MMHLLSLAVLVILISNPQQGVAQQLACDDCQAVLMHEVRLGESGVPLSGSINSLERSPGGNIYLVDSQAPHEVLVFDSNGQHILSVGREGSGPGEFRRIGALAWSSEGLHVYDDENRRETVISPDGTILLSRGIPHRVEGALVLDDDLQVVNMDIPTSELIGLPLHVLSEGRITASFGAGTGAHRPDISYLSHRRLARAGDQSFWAAHRLRYELELWTAEGEQLRRISRPVRWFEPTTEWHGFHRDRPPAPLIADIETDQDGFIRILINVADPHWEQAIERVQDEHGERWIPSSANGYFDTILEVVDPANNQVLVHTRFDEMITQFAGADHVAAPRQDETEAVVRVWRIDFRVPSRR